MPKRKKEIERMDHLFAQANAKLGQSERAVFGVCNMEKTVIRARYWGGEITQNEPEILIPERLEKLLFPKSRKVIYGGRGSAKTRTIASILTELIRRENKRCVCLREVLKTLAQSCYKEIEDEVDRRNLRNTEMKVIQNNFKSYLGRGECWFTGMRNNLTGMKGLASVNIAWLEEVQDMSLLSWDTIDNTVRAPGSEVWCSFNPNQETDPAWTELVEPYFDKMVDGIYEDDEILVIECNHMHNPWFNDTTLPAKMEKMKARDYDRYLWIYEGKFNKKSAVEVMNGKWEKKEFTPHPSWSGPYYGADFGFSQDPSTLIKIWIDDENEDLYIEHECWGIGVELDDMPEFYDEIEGSRDETIYGDCSRPETISHIKNKGFDIRAAEKWSGSVEDGVTYLRSFNRIYIHTRCVETLKEAKLYKYKVDPLTEEILTVIIDKHNHCWDAIRYGLFKQIKQLRNSLDED